MLAIRICQGQAKKWKGLSSWLRRKKNYAEVAKIYGKKEFSVCEIVKKKKEICASFAVTPQIA